MLEYWALTVRHDLATVVRGRTSQNCQNCDRTSKIYFYSEGQRWEVGSFEVKTRASLHRKHFSNLYSKLSTSRLEVVRIAAAMKNAPGNVAIFGAVEIAIALTGVNF